MATKRCDDHGLTYDPAIHTGCVLCRGRQRAPLPPKRRSWFLPGLTVVVCGISLVSFQVARQRNTQQLARLERAAGAPVPLTEAQPPIDPKAPPPRPVPDALKLYDNKLLVGTWLAVRGTAPVLGNRIDLFADGGIRVRQDMRTVEGRFELVARDRMAIKLVTPGGTIVDNQQYTFSVTPNTLEIHRVGTPLSARFGRPVPKG